MKPGFGKVSIPLSLAREIDALVGRRNRDVFMTETLRRYLADPELLSTLTLKSRERES